MEQLGYISINDLKWNGNTSALDKRANTRLRTIASVTSSPDDRKCICILHVRSKLDRRKFQWFSKIPKCPVKIIGEYPLPKSVWRMIKWNSLKSEIT